MPRKGLPVKLLFAHEHLGQFGGAETNIQLAAEELRNRGFRLDLLYQCRTGRGEQAWQRLFQQLLCVPESRKAEWVKETLRELQPDLIYLHNLKDLEVLRVITAEGVPVVRMVHDHSLYCLRTYKYNYFSRQICTRPASGYCVVPCLASLARNSEGPLPVKWVSYAHKSQEMRLARRCERLVVYSEYQKRELVNNGFASEKIHTCSPIRMFPGTAAIPSTKKGNLILYAGQILRGKGVDVLLRALARIQTDFECVILGDGNHRPYCERLSRRLGLKGRVEFRGFVPHAESEDLYRKASVFVMSSLWPEPFGMAGPEAMRYQLPVVAFDAGGISEWLIDGHNGFLVPWKDIPSFANRVEELLQKPDRARELGRRASLWVRRYDSTRQLDSLQRLFEDLIQTRQRVRTAVPAVEANPVCI